MFDDLLDQNWMCACIKHRRNDQNVEISEIRLGCGGINVSGSVWEPFCTRMYVNTAYMTQRSDVNDYICINWSHICSHSDSGPLSGNKDVAQSDMEEFY